MRGVVLTYHDVVVPGAQPASGYAGAGPDSYKVSPLQLAAHLDALAAARIECTLTFDDGGRSAVDVVAPLLEERGLQGRFFVVTDRIGDPGFVSAEDCRRLRDGGHVVGSHGATHRPLARLSDAEIEREWRESRTALGEILGALPDEASAPRGSYDRRVSRLAAAAGYGRLYTSEPWRAPRRRSSLEEWGRFAVRATSTRDDVVALGSMSPRTHARIAAGWYVRKGARRALGPVYESARTRVLSRR